MRARRRGRTRRTLDDGRVEIYGRQLATARWSSAADRRGLFTNAFFAVRAKIIRKTTSASEETSKHAIRPRTNTPITAWPYVPSAPRPARQPQASSNKVAAVEKYRTRGGAPDLLSFREYQAMVSANTPRKAAIKRLASFQTTSDGRRRKNNRLGSKARNSAPILAPNIPARDQVSRGDQ